MDHYDHHRVLAAGETESRAVAFEKVNLEKFMESVDEDDEGNVCREKVCNYVVSMIDSSWHTRDNEIQQEVGMKSVAPPPRA